MSITLEEFLERRPNDEHHRVVRCYCNHDYCQGWAQQYLWNDGMGEDKIHGWEMEIDELGPGQ